MIERMVTLRGLEPPTKSLGNSCSIHLSYRVPQECTAQRRRGHTKTAAHGAEFAKLLSGENTPAPGSARCVSLVAISLRRRPSGRGAANGDGDHGRSVDEHRVSLQRR